MHDPREEVLFEPKVRSDEPVIRRSQRVLTVEDLAARRAEESETATLAEEPAAMTAVPAPPAPPVDPESSLRYARIGFVAAATLALLLVWIMQRRKGM